jgi:altronate dehydratase
LKRHGAPFRRRLGCVGRSGREDHHRVLNGAQVFRIAGLVMKAKPSVDFGDYWQRYLAA